MASGDCSESDDQVQECATIGQGGAVPKLTCWHRKPLLPSDLAYGIAVDVVSCPEQQISGFLGKPLACLGKSALCIGLDGTVSSLCVLVVSKTSLVHYTKRDKASCAKTEAQGRPIEIGASSAIDEKYWKRRYNYFSRFDDGIRMDKDAWFEVTPESIARHIADRMHYDLVVDGTCGVGGNAIQFAMTSNKVIGVDIDSGRLKDAAHNAAVYGVQGRIDFVHDDFVHFAASYKGPPIDAIFLSPPC